MNIVLVNSDPFENNVRVTDDNAGGSLILEDLFPANSERGIVCTENSAGFGKITTYVDGHAPTLRSFLSEGERVEIY